jgi:hypothetical protein
METNAFRCADFVTAKSMLFPGTQIMNSNALAWNYYTNNAQPTEMNFTRPNKVAQEMKGFGLQ